MEVMEASMEGFGTFHGSFHGSLTVEGCEPSVEASMEGSTGCEPSMEPSMEGSQPSVEARRWKVLNLPWKLPWKVLEPSMEASTVEASTPVEG